MGSKSLDLRFAGAGGVILSGTLLLPMISEIQKVPGVVLIAGSGPTDRDGNNPMVPGRIDLLKQIAERLAQAGIASLRYDKRGIGASTAAPQGLAGREKFFTWPNLVGDVQAARAELLRHDEIKPYATAFLGHSEGGVLALAAAQAREHRPYAIVLAATPGRTMRDIIRHQLSGSAIADAAERAMTSIVSSGQVPAGLEGDMALIFPPYIGPYLRDALVFDPASALANLDTPCLLVNGGSDTQIVPMDDIQPLVDVLAKRSAPGEVRVFPMVSHALKAVSGPADPGFVGPIAPAVADTLADWLRRVLGA
jgi:pimeloyl-ACP methyl ester carboxylesterase